MSKSVMGWINANVWYASGPDKMWIPGKVQGVSSSIDDPMQYTFRIENTEMEFITIITVPLDIFLVEFQHVKKRDIAATGTVTDMTSLSFLNEPEMVECLRRRYFDRFIYTSIGPILVAVNPFEQLNEDVYSTKTIEKYFEADQMTLKGLGPHVFQISNSAYTHMFIDKYDPDKRENQSILINGESGAGELLSLIHYFN
jgi:myosin V